MVALLFGSIALSGLILCGGALLFIGIVLLMRHERARIEAQQSATWKCRVGDYGDPND